MKLYKLTNRNMRTFGSFQWELGIPSRELSGKGELCGPDFYHAYTDPFLAMLLNPIHAGIKNCLLFEAVGDVVKSDHGLKVGCKSLTLVKQLLVEEYRFPTLARVRVAILCALEVNLSGEFRKWAENWLSGKDRTPSEAKATWRMMRSLRWKGQVTSEAAEVAAGAAAEVESETVERLAAWAVTWAAESRAPTTFDFPTLVRKAIRDDEEERRLQSQGACGV